nr:uncharacterized acetyltransferase At3g50280-like [Ipomoea batatas]
MSGTSIGGVDVPEESIPTYAPAGDVLSRDLRWCAEQLNKNVKSHDDAMVRNYVAGWESDPRCFPLGNFDGAMLTMGSSPRFPMYDNDFGWGRPLAVRSGRANKFDGKISAFPGREGGGTVDLESRKTFSALNLSIKAKLTRYLSESDSVVGVRSPPTEKITQKFHLFGRRIPPPTFRPPPPPPQPTLGGASA